MVVIHNCISMSQFQEKKMLIESMKKLLTHVANNPRRQLEIFQALSTHDLSKIVQHLKDDNEYLRRVSALLLCELFYRNEENKITATSLLKIYPAQEGRICLGGFPPSVCRDPLVLKKCVQLMRVPLFQQEQTKMCWIINIEKSNLKLEFMDYRQYSSFTFIDPAKFLFGFSIPVKKEQKRPNVSQGQSNRLKYAVGSPSKNLEANSELYKKYVQARQRTKDSKRNSFNSNYINMSLNMSEDTSQLETYARPITSRLNIQPQMTTPKKEKVNTTFDTQKMNVVSPYARNSFGGNVKNTVNYSNEVRHKQKDPSSTIHHQDSGYRQIQTDRRADSNSQYPKSSANTRQTAEGAYFRAKGIFGK